MKAGFLPEAPFCFASRPCGNNTKRTLLIGLLVIVSLSLLTIYLLYERRLLMPQERADEAERQIDQCPGGGACRLASELHDDFSQRMAVLSLGLETAADMIPDSPEEANRQLQELMNSAGEIGADLHTLSHRLHSSTLERLGLAAGVSSFCKEFTAQQGTQIAFSHDTCRARSRPRWPYACFESSKKGFGTSRSTAKLVMRK